jgi:NAD(P)-dependent dehydrogenase (short-subunit alcohol dehydrogenase family)
MVERARIKLIDRAEACMMTPFHRAALIVGAGHGLSAALARRLAREGMLVALAARNVEKLADVAEQTGAATYACDATDPAAVRRLFAQAETSIGVPDLVVYNAGFRARGALVEIEPEAVREALIVNAYGAFLVAQEAARRMIKKGAGAIFFTGASASVKGYAKSSPFAMGKFALRGLAQSLARELAPQGVHVAHFVIDGGMLGPGRVEDPDRPDSLLDPEAVAETYLHALRQPRSAWTWEFELRPWVEPF